ncbi:MAG: NAD(P)H dehydrogenase subunit NdhS [Cyanobacteria bacterium P01_D01_bin.123]
MNVSILPGVPVRVANPDDIYYGFQGQVQRVMTDGRVAVIFGGGNWEKMVTFRVDELETAEKSKAPPPR